MPVTDITKDVDARTLTITARVRGTGRARLGALRRPPPARAGVGTRRSTRPRSSTTTCAPAVG